MLRGNPVRRRPFPYLQGRASERVPMLYAIAYMCAVFSLQASRGVRLYWQEGVVCRRFARGQAAMRLSNAGLIEPGLPAADALDRLFLFVHSHPSLGNERVLLLTGVAMRMKPWLMLRSEGAFEVV